MTGNSAAVAEMKEITALMRDSGLTVLASSGWEDRGRSSSVNYWAVLAHHTAAENDNDSLLINGRPDVSGPLCNWALHEYGDWVTIASGRANHAGEGTLPSSESYGVEATGPQDYPDKYGPSAFPNNYESYVVGVACMLAVMNGDISDLFGHKETATPPGRKIDPFFDMGTFRRDVDAGAIGEDGFLMALSDAEQNEVLKACRQVNAAVGKGQSNYEGTIESTLSVAQSTYNEAHTVHQALVVPGTTTAEESFNMLFDRVRTIEKKVNELYASAFPPESARSEPLVDNPGDNSAKPSTTG